MGFVASENILTLGRLYPELLIIAYLALEKRETLLARRLKDFAFLNVRQRLVHLLLELAEEHKVQQGNRVRIEFPLYLRDLAEMVGASRQATCEELALLRRQGLIELAWPTIFITDLERLRQLR